MKIYYATQFKKQYRKFSKKHQEKFEERLALFLRDPKDPQLNIHKLSGNYEELWSMNITGDLRAVFDLHHPGAILFVAIGTHSELYS